jgi:hypothetical protein
MTIAKAVRDLDWVIHSPSLLKGPLEPDLQSLSDTQALLDRLKENPAPLHQFLATAKRHALGSYFEQLVIFWVSNLPSVKWIKSNLQLRHEKQTLGEFDLIFEHGGAIYHWELAVKFYLNIGRDDQESSYVGPRLKDNLARKLDRLFSHQLCLPSHPQARPFLARHGISFVSSFPFVKGLLFQHLQQQEDVQAALPERVSPEHLTGAWLSISELLLEPAENIQGFRFLQKLDWLTSRYFASEMTTGNWPQFVEVARKILNQEKRPVQVCLFDQSGPYPVREMRRLFIVPEDWPGLTA